MKRYAYCGLQVGDHVTYRPRDVVSRYEGHTVVIVAINRHGHVTIEFPDGPLKNQTRGVRMDEVSR